MRQVIKAKLLITFFLSFSTFACEFNTPQPVLSLSGPISHLLKRLDLLGHPQVKAISIFHGIGASDFKGDRLGGGVFLSGDYLKKFSSPLVFIDESMELRKNLEHQKLLPIEIKTRNLDPFQAYKISLEKLAPYLKGCEKKITNMELYVADQMKRSRSFTKLKGTFIFYLGELRGVGRPPNLIMVDNFVLWFKNKILLETYPTKLNYAPWSEKVMKILLKGKVIEIGLINKETKDNLLVVQTLSKTKINLIHPSLLIPGIAQIDLLQPLWEKLSSL